jgi:hypothetical protein
MRNVGHLFAGGRFPSFERDPEINKLEYSVLEKMSAITQEMAEKYGHSAVQNEAVRFVSVEEAIKELAEMEKNKLL